MDEKMIVIGVGSRPEGAEYGPELEMAEEEDAKVYEAMAPRGTFTSRGLDPLVRATNGLLPLFDQTPDYPKVEDTDVLPTDFVRVLVMFKEAIDEAIEQDVLRPEMAISLDDVRDDTALMALAGKIDMVAKDREFKRFLSEPIEEEELAEEVREDVMGPQMSMEEEDDFMMGRM